MAWWPVFRRFISPCSVHLLGSCANVCCRCSCCTLQGWRWSLKLTLQGWCCSFRLMLQGWRSSFRLMLQGWRWSFKLMLQGWRCSFRLTLQGWRCCLGGPLLRGLFSHRTCHMCLHCEVTQTRDALRIHSGLQGRRDREDVTQGRRCGGSADTLSASCPLNGRNPCVIRVCIESPVRGKSAGRRRLNKAGAVMEWCLYCWVRRAGSRRVRLA